MSSFVYGPVPSRRLGRSLGVDIVPFKICTYDCIYCQLGRTTQKTLDRAEVMASFPTPRRAPQFETRRDEILSLLSRRPCSMDDVANGLMLNKKQLIKCLEELVSQGLVTYDYRTGRLYYMKGIG